MKTLKKILCMSDKELGPYLLHNLKKYYDKVETDKDNYIYAKGTGEICLVAHIDTVRSAVDNNVMLTINRNVIRNAKGVLGADDRAGVYGILEVIKICIECKTPLPSVLFTNYEESGGRGVKKFIAAKKFHPEGLKLLVELDRKGCNEYVYYSTTLPKPIKDYIESFGFKEERGSYSDISDLTDEYLVPSVNVSVGYYNQHTGNEKLHYDELLMTIDRVADICLDPPAKLHPVEKTNYGAWKGSGRSNYGVYCGDHYGDEYDYFNYNKNANKNYAASKAGVVGVNTVAPVAVNKVTSVLTGDSLGSDKLIAQLILRLKDEIKSELTTVYTLDTIAERYLSHEHAISIIDKMSEIEDSYYENMTFGKTGLEAFHDTWEDLLTKAFYKISPKTVNNTLACTR